MPTRTWYLAVRGRMSSKGARWANRINRLQLPAAGFDPSEAAVTWSVLRDGGHEMTFATPDGRPAQADPIMLTGRGLTLGGPILRANRTARHAYAAMVQDAAYRSPSTYDAIETANFDALLLPGGHAKTMRPYLESATLQACVAEFFDGGKPVAAICHGPVLAARSISSRTQRSVLYGRKTTALTWALERKAWNVGRIVRFWDPSYYRTYEEAPGEPPGYRSVQAEVTRALADGADFLEPASSEPDFRFKTDGIHRDTLEDARAAFVVRDGNYVSARWPGDAHLFARTFANVLGESGR